MIEDRSSSNLQWISIFSRLIVSILFLVTAFHQILNNLARVSVRAESLFFGTLVPIEFARTIVSILPYAQFLLGIGLLSGVKLRAFWIASAFLMISLCIGLLVLEKYDFATDNFIYLLMIFAGLYSEPYDRFQVR